MVLESILGKEYSMLECGHGMHYVSAILTIIQKPPLVKCHFLGSKSDLFYIQFHSLVTNITARLYVILFSISLKKFVHRDCCITYAEIIKEIDKGDESKF